MRRIRCSGPADFVRWSGMDHRRNRTAPNLSRLTRRRALTLLGGTAAATIGGGLIAGCGAGTGTGAPERLAYATPDFAGARLTALMRNAFLRSVNLLTTEQAEAWAEATNASVELLYLDDWRERYAEAAALRRGEDMAELFSTAPHLFGDRLVDVSELAEQIGEESGGWVEAARAAAMVDGRWRAIPWAYTAQALNYRPSILDAAGVQPPETWDELLEAATALHEQRLPLAGFSMSAAGPNDSANLAYSMLWSFGGQEVDGETGLVALDSLGTRDALRCFQQISEVTDPHGPSFDEGDNNEHFLNGDISMTLNASSIFWRAVNEFPDIASDIGHLQVPSGPTGRHQLLELNALAVFEHCRNKGAALDLIRHLVSPERLRDRTKVSEAFFIPPLFGYLDDPEMPWNAVPALAAWRGTGTTGRLPGWPGPAGKEASLAYQNGTIVQMFGSVASGEETVDSAVRIATRALKRVYET